MPFYYEGLRHLNRNLYAYGVNAWDTNVYVALSNDPSAANIYLTRLEDIQQISDPNYTPDGFQSAFTLGYYYLGGEYVATYSGGVLVPSISSEFRYLVFHKDRDLILFYDLGQPTTSAPSGLEFRFPDGQAVSIINTYDLTLYRHTPWVFARYILTRYANGDYSVPIKVALSRHKSALNRNATHIDEIEQIGGPYYPPGGYDGYFSLERHANGYALVPQLPIYITPSEYSENAYVGPFKTAVFYLPPGMGWPTEAEGLVIAYATLGSYIVRGYTTAAIDFPTGVFIQISE